MTPEERAQWKKITTVPKDGTVIDLWLVEDGKCFNEGYLIGKVKYEPLHQSFCGHFHVEGGLAPFQIAAVSDIYRLTHWRERA